MNNKEILLVVDAVSNEKGVEKEIIFQAIEAALASAAKKRSLGDIEVRVAIDRKSGDHETFRRWQVVDENDEELEEFIADQMIRIEDAKAQNPALELGDWIEEPMEGVNFGGRIAAQTAKQVIVQKVREAERKRVIEAYEGRENELVTGIVKRVERGNIYIDLGSNAEAMIPRDKTIPRESIRSGDRIRGVLYEINEEVRGPQLFVSRTAPKLIMELFKIEVPEVSHGLIEILAAARDPGSRAKIAVKSNDPRIDPVGACVGMRGSRVQAVSNELSGERVDIIPWDENAAQFVINAMSPAEVQSIVMDEETRSMDIAVAEDKLSQAIGRGGQNVRLASQLTGWELNVMSEADAEAKSEAEGQKLQQLFMDQLDVDDEVAAILVQEGFTTLEEVAYVPTEELLGIEEFDEDIVEELRNRARDALLTKAIAAEEEFSSEPAEDLLNMDGMDRELAYQLASRGVVTMEDLAEQATDDLLDIEGMDEERAAQLIMTARAPWFEDGE